MVFKKTVLIFLMRLFPYDDVFLRWFKKCESMKYVFDILNLRKLIAIYVNTEIY